MDLNQPLLWLGLMGGLVMLIRGVKSWSLGGRSWSLVGLLVLAVGGAAYLRWPDAAGYVTFGVWALLVLGPNLVARSLQLAVDRQQHDTAAKLARLLAVVHPSDSTRLVVLDRAIAACTQRGDTRGAEELLLRASSLGGISAKWAAIERLRVVANWAAIATTFDETITDADVRALPSLVGVYVRALGETGQRAAMWRAFMRFSHSLDGDALARQRAVVWLIVLAFSGKRAEIDRILSSRLTSFTPQLVRFWRATADLAAGGDDGATAALEDLERATDVQMSRAARRRLAERATLTREPLTPLEEIECAAIMRTFDQEDRFGLSSAGRPHPVMVLTLIVLNVIGYGIEWIAGDPTNEDTLFKVGALLSSAVVKQHEWWRLGTCLFLHFGAVHLVMNMLGLWVLGPFVEYSLGRARWLFVYLASGLVGSIVLTVLPLLHWVDEEKCVGASGSIMGLVGATIAITLRGVLRERALIAKRRLMALGLIVVLQTTFDLLTPQVSFLAHASGLVSGFLFASMLVHRRAKSTEPLPGPMAVGVA